MDIRHVLSCNPLRPSYLRQDHRRADTALPKAGWIERGGGVAGIGHTGQGFGFDNPPSSSLIHCSLNL